MKVPLSDTFSQSDGRHTGNRDQLFRAVALGAAATACADVCTGARSIRNQSRRDDDPSSLSRARPREARTARVIADGYMPGIRCIVPL